MKSKDNISFKLDSKFNQIDNLKRKYRVSQLSNLNNNDIIFYFSYRDALAII